MKYSIVVHGGAGGWDGSSDEKQKKLIEACKLGEEMLKKGKKAVDVVEKVVNFMEDESIFNAGIGSVLNLDGDADMDASIMRGNSKLYYNCGAVAGIKNIKNPISVARKVMEKTPHVLLISDGANQFANLMGFKEDKNIITKDRIDERQRLLDKFNSGDTKAHKRLKKLVDEHPEILCGTVGCVAFDGKEIVAGTSTGGMPLKLFGRVGDSALIGSGTYANDKIGISCTGTGEISIKFVLAKTVADNYEVLGNLKEATKKSIDVVKKKYPKRTTAFISIDKNGEISCESVLKLGYACATDKKISEFVKI